MTIETDGAFNEKMQIINLQPAKLEPLKAAHKQGEVIRLLFSDEFEGLHEKAFKKFHALRDEFADASGYEKEYAKALLKHRHGKSLPYVEGFAPPLGERGAFFEVSGAIVWLKSSTVMTTDELAKLILGTEKDIGEAGA